MLNACLTWPQIFCLGDCLTSPVVSSVLYCELETCFLIWISLEAFLSLTSTFPPSLWEAVHLGEYARMWYDFLRNMKLWIRMAVSHCFLRGNTSKSPEALSGTFHCSLVEPWHPHPAADSKQWKQLECPGLKVFSNHTAQDFQLLLLLAFPCLVSQKHQITGGIDFKVAWLVGNMNTHRKG